MRLGMYTVLAAGLIFFSTGATWATDTVRLGGPSAQAAIDGGTDNQLVYYRHHHRHHNYYSYGYGRSYYSSYYRPYYYSPYYYSPYSYSSYYSPYSYSSYYQPVYPSTYYYRPAPAYYSAPAYYNPCATTTAPALTLQVNPPSSSLLPAPRSYTAPLPTIVPNGDGTFPYDGGPRSPVPMPPPGDSLTPMKGQPRGIIPLEGKLVSLPNQATGGVSSISAPNSPRWTLVSMTPAPSQLKSTPTARINYPAYGDEPIPPAPRKIVHR